MTSPTLLELHSPTPALSEEDLPTLKGQAVGLPGKEMQEGPAFLVGDGGGGGWGVRPWESHHTFLSSSFPFEKIKELT